MKWKLGVLVLALMIAVLPAAAKGQFNRVVITGDALEQPITVTDPFTVSFLSLGILEELRAVGSVEAPADAVAVGYDLERQWEEGTGALQTFDHVRYHPNVNAAERGYVYMAGTAIGRSNYNGKWLPATAEGDAAMRAILAGEPLACPVTPTDNASGQSLFGSDSIRLLPLKIDGLGETTIEGSPNVAGTVLLDDSVSGSFWMGITWLQGASRTPIRFDDATDWQDNLELERVERSQGVETAYEWEAIFAEPGCYSVYTSAGNEWVTMYVELLEND